MNVDNRSLFEQIESQEMTWESKHIRFFLNLPKLGRARVRKIIEMNPDIYKWDKDSVINQLGLESLKDSLPEQIPDLTDLDSNEVVNFTEKHFPDNLKRMEKDGPLLLWYRGNLNIEKSLAVVGSRNMIEETSYIIESFVRKASDGDYSIISGLALGVDTKAHVCALENNAKTVAILPSSLDNILPSSNRGLAGEIVEHGGLLLSEYEPGTVDNPPNRNYLMRNRLQAGMSDAVFIAQSGIQGGTMTTAYHAINNDKKIITYSSKNNIEEYAGNRYLTTPLNESFDFSKMNFTKSQISTLLNKDSLADYTFEDVSELSLNSIL
jgi:DNA protecting protein DprA